MQVRTLLCLAPLLGAGCATPPYQEPFQATVVAPSAGEAVVVDQTLVLFDSSGSIAKGESWPGDKALLESYVAGMPEGSYRAGSTNFGGKSRQRAGLARFDRERLATHANEIRYFGNATPLEDVLRDAADQLDGAGGQAAIVLFTDGVPTVMGTPRSGEAELAVAQDLIERHGGTVCFHAIQTGSGEGAEFLQKLTELTSCGSIRDASSVDGGSQLLAFQREVFMGAGPLPVSSPPPDTDRDGVLDSVDACKGTPLGATVDPRGCWVLSDLRFDSSSASMAPAELTEVDGIAQVMKENPDLRIRVDGHTDSTGPADFNQGLSERRASAVKDRLVGEGIDPARLETQGFGASSPVAPNSTREGRYANRRIEFSVLR